MSARGTLAEGEPLLVFCVCAHPCPSEFVSIRVCTPVFVRGQVWVSFYVCVCVCVCVCEEQSSAVVSAPISSDVIYGNKCIRTLLNMPLSFPKSSAGFKQCCSSCHIKLNTVVINGCGLPLPEKTSVCCLT